MTADGPEHLKYRADIDGLRAIAVLSVIAYHAFPTTLTGGFVGVDIFFVISGYLITSIILADLARNQFSYLTFYSRRIRRIFPALILVLGVVWVAGWVRLFPDDYRQLGLHVGWCATFVSNFILRNQAGYFDSNAETKPLLHLWSLAIEEQFYIFWPLILAVLVRRATSLRLATIVICTIAIVSFVFEVATTHDEPIAAFYSPFARFWELMAGGLLARLLTSPRPGLERFQNLTSIVGLAALVFAICSFSAGIPYPGWRALIPVFGAFLVISAGPTAWANRNILGSRPAVWFGRISYPLYLWHWPLLSFSLIDQNEKPGRIVRLMIVLTSVALAWLTYQLVEKPIRRSSNFRTLPLGLFGLLAAVGAMA